MYIVCIKAARPTWSLFCAWTFVLYATFYNRDFEGFSCAHVWKKNEERENTNTLLKLTSHVTKLVANMYLFFSWALFIIFWAVCTCTYKVLTEKKMFSVIYLWNNVFRMDFSSVIFLHFITSIPAFLDLCFCLLYSDFKGLFCTL